LAKKALVVWVVGQLQWVQLVEKSKVKEKSFGLVNILGTTMVKLLTLLLCDKTS
jgi:hypothetical protein